MAEGTIGEGGGGEGVSTSAVGAIGGGCAKIEFGAGAAIVANAVIRPVHIDA